MDKDEIPKVIMDIFNKLMDGHDISYMEICHLHCYHLFSKEYTEMGETFRLTKLGRKINSQKRSDSPIIAISQPPKLSTSG